MIRVAQTSVTDDVALLHEDDVALLAAANAIREADDLYAAVDPTGIERAKLERWRDHQAETVDWLRERLCWSNYWAAREAERLRWLSIAERALG